MKASGLMVGLIIFMFPHIAYFFIILLMNMKQDDLNYFILLTYIIVFEICSVDDAPENKLGDLQTS